MNPRFKLGDPVRVVEDHHTQWSGHAGFVTAHDTELPAKPEPHYRVHFGSGVYSYFPESALEAAVEAPTTETEYEYAVRYRPAPEVDDWIRAAGRERAEEFIRDYGGVLYRRPVGEWGVVPDDE